MCGNIEESHTQRVPCALQQYWRRKGLVPGSNGIPEDQRQMAFQNWVAYDRAQSLDVSPKEHLMCPLLWCRGNFKDLASTLQHVSNCPCLSNGWYWCPYCCRPERFVDGEGSIADFPRCLPQRKGSKLKRAVSFFKNLGLKGCSRSRRSSTTICPASASYENRDREADERNIYELADTEPAELFGDIGYDHSLPSRTSLEVENMHKTEQPPPYDSVMTVDGASYASCAAQVNDAQLTSMLEKIGTSRNVNASYCANNGKPTDLEEDKIPVSPLLEVQELSTHHAVPDMFSEAISGAISPTWDPFNSMSSLENAHNVYLQGRAIGRSVATTELTSVYEEIQPRFHGKLPSAQSQIEELRDIVHILNFEWTRRLDSAEGFNAHPSEYHIHSLFETGIQALQRCYQNQLPQTFKEILALMHVACAAVYMMHGKDAQYCWSELFRDMREWQYATWNARDVQLLLASINLLWCPDQGFPPYGACNCVMTAQESAFHAATKRTADGPGSPGLVDVLKNGSVIKECSRFLNTFECVNLIEDRNFNRTTLVWYASNHVTNIQDLISKITEPLLQRRDYSDALRDIVADTDEHLRAGWLRNVREVEVWLTSSGRPASVSCRGYETFLQDVTSICNNYMQELSLSLRERSYITDLDQFIAMSLEIDRSQRQAAERALRHHTSPEPVATSSTGRAYGSPTSECSINRHAGINSAATPSLSLASSSPSTSTPKSFTSPSPSTGYTSSTVSPDSPFSPASGLSPSSDDVTRCECGRVFRGMLHDRTSNLNRHVRTSRKHGNRKVIKCPIKGCMSILSRSDNLKKHQRIVHKTIEIATWRGVAKKARI